jgi:dynein light chain roadblock-type
MDAQTFDEMVRRLQTNKGVVGVIVTNQKGRAIKIAMDKTLGLQYLDGIKILESMATALIRDINPKDSLRLLRIQSRKYEIVLYKEKEYMLILIHGSDAIPSSNYHPHHRHTLKSNAQEANA